ncbi:MAG: glycosyltransferase family 39 protein [bacterium]|nr:glycosyltransferase family 39 protein [bacterium]
MPTRREWAAAAIGVVFATALAFLLPPYEAPDEPAHLAYANYIAEHGELPYQDDPARQVFGQGHQAPLYYVLAGLFVRVAKNDDRIWVRARPNPAHRWHGGMRTDVPNFAQSALGFPSTRDRLGFYGLRLLSVAASAGTVLAVGAAVRVVLGASAGAIAALLVATLPQFAAVSAAVTADDVTALLAALFAWQLLSGLVRPDDTRHFTRAGVLLGLALLTKKTTMCLLPGTVGALAIAASAGVTDWPGAVRRGLRVLVPALLLATPVFIRNALLYGDPLTVDMERRTLPFLVLDRALSDAYFWTDLPRLVAASFVGVLGWMNVWLPAPVYWLYGALALVIAGGLVPRLTRGGAERTALAVAAFFAVACFGGVVHYNRSFPQPQGRFMFVVVAFLAVLAAGGLLEAARRLRLDPDRLWWGLLVVLLAVDVATIVTVVDFFA